MPAPLETRAIVLSSRDMGESDLLVTLCAPDGKIKAVAKGAKRSRKRFLNALEPFTLINAILVPSRSSGLFRIDAAQIEKNLPSLRTDIRMYAFASLCCELVQMWTVEGDPQARIFNLLVWLLDMLSQDMAPQKITLFFKTRLLSLAGYAPDWARCAGYRQTAQICSQVSCPATDLCANLEPSPGVFKTLEHITRTRQELLHRLILSQESLDKSWDLIRELHCRHLHRCPASYKVLQKILR